MPLETPAPSPRLSWALPSCPGACFEDLIHSIFKEVLSLPRGPEPVPTGARATVVLQTDWAFPAGSLHEAWWRRTFLVLPAHLWPFLSAPAVVGMASIPIRYTGKPSFVPFVPLPRITEGWSRVKHTHKPQLLVQTAQRASTGLQCRAVGKGEKGLQAPQKAAPKWGTH